jgi:hypothetical protein
MIGAVHVRVGVTSLENHAYLSFPRKRESSPLWTDVDPRLRGGDEGGDFHLFGWATSP